MSAPATAVLEDFGLLTHILQHDPRVALRARFEEARASHATEKKAAEDAGQHFTKVWPEERWRGVDTICLSDVFEMRTVLMMTAKATCTFWRDVCRAALTDPDWIESDDACTVLNMMHQAKGLRLPMRCTLHPKLSPFETCTSGFFDGRQLDGIERVGNPRSSVCGTLLDLKVRPSTDNGHGIDVFEVEHMELSIDGVDDTFDTIWSPLASKFKLTRQICRDNCETALIDLGLELRGNYWLQFDSLYEILCDVEGFHKYHPAWLEQPRAPMSQILPNQNSHVQAAQAPRLLRADGSSCMSRL